MIFRFFFFVAILFCAVAAPAWLLALIALAYAFRYTGYELIFVAAAIDAFYGAGSFSFPYYTLAAAAGLICIEWVKPRISLYN